MRARHHHRIGRHFALMDGAGLAVDDAGRRAEIDAHREHRAFAHDHALGDLGARADEAVVLDDHRPGLQRLEHAADAGAAGDVAVLADLRAGADRRPGVDHGAGVDIGADIDERRHQHDAGRDIGRSAAPRSPAPRGSRPCGIARRSSRRTWRRPCPTTPPCRGAPRNTVMSFSRNDSSTAFLSHWLTRQ